MRALTGLTLLFAVLLGNVSAQAAPSVKSLNRTVPQAFRPERARNALSGKFEPGYRQVFLGGTSHRLAAEEMRPGDLVEMSGRKGVVQQVSTQQRSDGKTIYMVGVRESQRPGKVDTFELLEGLSLPGVKALKQPTR